jgi:ribosomal protein S20
MSPKQSTGLSAPGLPTAVASTTTSRLNQTSTHRTVAFTGPDPASILPQGVVNQDFVPAPIRKASMKTTSKKTLRKYENGAVNWDRAIFQGPSKELSAVRKAVYKRQKAERDMEVVLRVEEEMARKKEEKRVEEALGHVLRRWNGNETFDRYESGKRS